MLNDATLPTASRGGLLPRLALFAAFAAVLHAGWRSCRSTHLRRASERSAAESPPEQVWEGEGGQSQMSGALR